MIRLLFDDPQTLQSFALSNVLLAFDYDGTLAPIAATPRAARMREQTRQLLAEVAAQYPCVVISGRALDDLARRLADIPIWYVFGNHGLEPQADGRPPERDWLEDLYARLPQVDGLIIEDKGHSITLHYRDVADKPSAVAAIHGALEGLAGARAVAGIEAISVLPRDGRHKGLALQEARRLFVCDTAIYVGDDETDEDAFGSDDDERLLSIRIGDAPSKARYRLERQEDVDQLLSALLLARAGHPPRRSADPRQ